MGLSATNPSLIPLRSRHYSMAESGGIVNALFRKTCLQQVGTVTRMFKF